MVPSPSGTRGPFPTDRLRREEKGDVTMTTGWILFRYDDLNTASYTPKAGDKIVSISDPIYGQTLNVEYYMRNGGTPDAFYVGQGYTLLRVDFSDKKARDDRS